MKQQTCWTILRHFGYDDKLQLKRSWVEDGTVSDEELAACKNVELSKDSQAYLKRVFDAFKSREHGRLEEPQLEAVFSTTEQGIPWRVSQEAEQLTLEAWVGLWQKYFALAPRDAFRELLYIGYCGKMKDAVTLFKYKLTDALKVSKRKVLHAFVIGNVPAVRKHESHCL